MFLVVLLVGVQVGCNTSADYSLADHPTPRHRQIFWLHIQKTGTSIFNTVFFHFCPKTANEKDIKWFDLSLLERFPPSEWCPGARFLNLPCPGCHHPFIKLTNDRSAFTFTMIRDPVQRVLSAYYFRPGGMPHLYRPSPRGNKTIPSLEEFILSAGIVGCQTKMLAGHPCMADIHPTRLRGELKTAVENLGSLSFFGLTERWEESIALFHSLVGGHTREFEMFNNRPTKGREKRRVSKYDRVLHTLERVNDPDLDLHKEASRVFDCRLKNRV